MRDKIKKYIKESDDFSWTKDILPADEVRFFEIYSCYSSFYDEDTGEDECVDGGSYFIKIPTDVVPEIWDYDAESDYYTGPGDEGEGVIQWSVENGLISEDFVEYVTEITKNEYCRAWGKWNIGDEELCGGVSINESDDFDWVGDVNESNYLLNKAFYFNPIAVSGDRDYQKLIELFESSGFEGLYSTPLKLVGGDESVGLYTYRHKIDGSLCYVHTTHLDEDEDYYSHIRSFAYGESADHGYDVEVVDARKFINDSTLLEDLTEGAMYYKGVNPTVDFIVRRDDEILLIKRGSQSEMEPNKWALPGGFHDSNVKEGGRWKQDKESTLEAAKRELKEETGLDLNKYPDIIIEKVGVFDGVGRQPEDESWVQTTVYKTTIPNDVGNDVKGMDDAQDAKWFTVYEAMNMDLAFNHKDHIEKSLVLVEDAFSDMSISELLKESDDFEWTREIPDEVDFDLWNEVSGYIDDELSGPQMYINRDRPKFKQLRNILDDFDLDIEDLSDFFEFPPTLKNGEPMDNDELIELRERLVDEGFIYDDMNESVGDDFEWVENRILTKNSLMNILSDCEDILITTYNLTINHPYTKRGEFVRYYISTCPYWWDRLPNNEWLKDSDRGKNKVAIIMPKNNKSQKNIRDLKDDEFEVVTSPIGMCVNYFNANSSFNELWIFLDNNEQPIYDFIPKDVIEVVKQGFSEYHRENMNESVGDDFEWAKGVKPPPFYVGAKFIDTQDHDNELVYTVVDIDDNWITLSWYSGGEIDQYRAPLPALEGRYAEGYIIPFEDILFDD